MRELHFTHEYDLFFLLFTLFGGSGNLDDER